MVRPAGRVCANNSLATEEAGATCGIRPSAGSQWNRGAARKVSNSAPGQTHLGGGWQRAQEGGGVSTGPSALSRPSSCLASPDWQEGRTSSFSSIGTKYGSGNIGFWPRRQPATLPCQPHTDRKPFCSKRLRQVAEPQATPHFRTNDNRESDNRHVFARHVRIGSPRPFVATAGFQPTVGIHPPHPRCCPFNPGTRRPIP